MLLEHQLRKLWDNYRNETGLNATQHQLRHTYATMLFESGVDIKTAQDLMGHKDIRTMLQIYTHLSAAHKERNISKLDNYISDKYDKILQN